MKINTLDTTIDQQIIGKLKEDDLPVIIWGGGEVSSFVHKKLQKNGVKNIIHVQSEKSDKYMLDSEIDTVYGEYNVVAGFLNAYSFSEESFSIFKNRKAVYFMGDIHDTERISKEFFEKHKVDFNRVYKNLADEKSKESFVAYLMAKINEDASALRGKIEIPQYFSGDFLQFSDREFLVDCGAYIGDSIQDFVRATNGKYDGIIAFEPDKENVNTLTSYVQEEKLKNVEIYNKGAYDCATELHFNSDGILSKISDSAEFTIQTDTIDNIVSDHKVSFIKMDIEGSEMQALQGAKNVISRDHPTLGISAYHKADDLYKIFDFANDLYGGYKYYFRLHKHLPIDAVFYAVPY